MEYEVKLWVYFTENGFPACRFIPAEEVSDAMKQAIINDIRKHGYMFDEMCQTMPVLNTGECVVLEDELIEELICKAYGFDGETYQKYLAHAPNKPPMSEGQGFEDYPIKQAVWVLKDEFEGLKNELLSGKYNFEIIPTDGYMLRRGDVLRFTAEDSSDYFEVGIKAYAFGINLFALSDLKNLQNIDEESIVNLVARSDRFVSGNAFKDGTPLSYRFSGLAYETIQKQFEKCYGNYMLEFLSQAEFDCKIDLVVFDINARYERPILDCPKDNTDECADAIRELNQRYEASVKEENERLEKSRQTYLRLKEKLAQKKKP